MSLTSLRRLARSLGATAIALSLWCASGLGHASSERTVVLASFSLVATIVKDGRPIKVWGTQSAAGVDALNIDAFGRSFRLNKAQLAELRGLTVNNLQLSFDNSMIKQVPDRLLVQLAFGTIADGLIKTKVVYVHSDGELSMRGPFEQ